MFNKYGHNILNWVVRVSLYQFLIYWIYWIYSWLDWSV